MQYLVEMIYYRIYLHNRFIIYIIKIINFNIIQSTSTTAIDIETVLATVLSGLARSSVSS